jgi:DNA-binding transcriptional LysR family regulator
VRLTADGEAMLGYARELLEVLGRARRHFAQPPLEGSVRFGMVEELGATALPYILARLRREHPLFELTIETGLGPDLLRRLEAGSVDLVLTKRIAGRNQGTSLCRQKLVWVGQPGVFEAGNNIVPLVLFPSPSISREIILRTLREHGLRWSIRFESASIASLRAAVLAGLGVAVFRGRHDPEWRQRVTPIAASLIGRCRILVGWAPRLHRSCGKRFRFDLAPDRAVNHPAAR